MASIGQQISLDISNAVGNFQNAVFGASPSRRPNLRPDRDRRARNEANLKKMMSSGAASNKSDDGPGYRRTAGPTPDQLVAQQVAAERAAKRAAKKRMGKARRKKYEAAQTMVKKMKLLFEDQGSST